MVDRYKVAAFGKFCHIFPNDIFPVEKYTSK